MRIVKAGLFFIVSSLSQLCDLVFLVLAKVWQGDVHDQDRVPRAIKSSRNGEATSRLRHRRDVDLDLFAYGKGSVYLATRNSGDEVDVYGLDHVLAVDLHTLGDFRLEGYVEISRLVFRGFALSCELQGT